jgi:hypothetical protein
MSWIQSCRRHLYYRHVTFSAAFRTERGPVDANVPPKPKKGAEGVAVPKLSAPDLELPTVRRGRLDRDKFERFATLLQWLQMSKIGINRALTPQQRRPTRLH